jgi:hypothetical protein
MIMTREMKSEIKRQLKVQMSEMSAKEATINSTNQQLTNQIASFKIISIVRFSSIFNLSAVFDSQTFESMLDSTSFDSAFINPLVKTRDVYNIKTQMRRDELESMTSMQALMYQLDEND